MPDYPPLEAPVPAMFSQDQLRAAENALRQLPVANALIERCERCKIPVAEARADCDGLCQFFQNILAEARGQQTGVPTAMG